MAFSAPISLGRLGLCCFLALNLQACATMAAPEIATINLVSINKATVIDAIVMGEHSEEFDAPGYKIVFESDREIAPQDNFSRDDVFVALHFYNCDSSERYEAGHAYSAFDYVIIQQSWADLIESKPNGSFIYEAQFIEGNNEKNQSICSKIFVTDGNINRKIWQPIFVSNEMKLDFNSSKNPELL